MTSNLAKPITEARIEHEIQFSRLAGTVTLNRRGLKLGDSRSSATELFVRQPPDCATDNEHGDLAIVPYDKVRVRHLTVPICGRSDDVTVPARESCLELIFSTRVPGRKAIVGVIRSSQGVNLNGVERAD